MTPDQVTPAMLDQAMWEATIIMMVIIWVGFVVYLIVKAPK